MSKTAKNARKYVEKWKKQGYSEDIPDEVPSELMTHNLAPSYKALALAILKNDHGFESLGFLPQKSKWYSAIKKVEIAERERNRPSGEQRPKLFDLLCG